MSDDPFVQKLMELRRPVPLEHVLRQLVATSMHHEIALRGIAASLTAAGITLLEPDADTPAEPEEPEPEKLNVYTRFVLDGKELGPPPPHPLGY